MTNEQKQELIKALEAKGYNSIDARNVAYGDETIALARYYEYCEKRIVLHDLFIGTYRMSQKFGVNKPNYIKYGLQGHDGVDWACPTGTKLISPVDGLVISVAYHKGGYGTHIKILDLKQKCSVLMAHMKTVNVKLGQSVRIGQLVGLSDNTGNSTGSHLHFGLCQTNILGYRINRDNGFLGWINPLNNHIVKWVVSNPNNPL